MFVGKTIFEQKLPQMHFTISTLLKQQIWFGIQITKRHQRSYILGFHATIIQWFNVVLHCLAIALVLDRFSAGIRQYDQNSCYSADLVKSQAIVSYVSDEPLTIYVFGLTERSS